MIGRPTKRAWDDGFTLLELLIVLAVVSGTTAVVLTLARPSTASLEPRRTALEMAASLRNARSHAIEFNQETSFTLDMKGRNFWTTISDRRLPVPATLDLSMTSAKTAVPVSDRGQISFFSDGSSSGGTVVLTAGGREATVEVNWLTGAPRVADD